MKSGPPAGKGQEKKGQGLLVALVIGGVLAVLIGGVILAHWLTMRVCEGIAALTDSEQVLSEGGSSAGIFVVALFGFSGLGVIAYCLVLLRRRPPSGTRSSKASSSMAALAVLFAVVNALLIIVTAPGANSSTPDSTSDLIQSDSDVGELSADMLQAAIWSTWVVLLALVVVWAILRKRSFKIRAGVGLPALVLVLVVTALTLGGAYVG